MPVETYSGVSHIGTSHQFKMKVMNDGSVVEEAVGRRAAGTRGEGGWGLEGGGEVGFNFQP